MEQPANTESLSSHEGAHTVDPYLLDSRGRLEFLSLGAPLELEMLLWGLEGILNITREQVMDLLGFSEAKVRDESHLIRLAIAGVDTHSDGGYILRFKGIRICDLNSHLHIPSLHVREDGSIVRL